MLRKLKLNLGLASLLFAACVTINVYFPAAAAEKAADQIIDTVTGTAPANAAPAETPRAPAPAQPNNSPPKAGSSNGHTLSLLREFSGRTLGALFPAAYAQADANIDITSTEIRAITASMQARFEQLKKFFDAGNVGLTVDGLIEIRDQSGIALPDRALVKRLVAEDNRDRNTLYAEIAKANGHAEWEADIRKIFARRWVERGAQPGWYYQAPGGAWQQKK